MLTLHAALAASVVQRPGSVEHWLGEARQLAARLPDDMASNWQSFGSTNVQLWAVAIGVERGEAGGTVLERARAVDQAKITYRTRLAPCLADVGRGLAREPRMRDDAVRW